MQFILVKISYSMLIWVYTIETNTMEMMETPSSPGIQTPPPGSFSYPSQPKRRWLWISLPVAVIVILGGSYLAHSMGFIALPFLTPSSSQLFDKMIDSMGSIKNAQYAFSMNLTAEPRESANSSFGIPTALAVQFIDVDEPEDIPLTLDSGTTLDSSVMEDYSEYLFQMLPPDVSIQGNIGLYFEQSENIQDSRGFITISGQYAGGDATYEVDLELRKIGPGMYGVVNKMPTIFFLDFSPIKGKWVELNSPTNTTIYENDDFTSAEETFDTKQLKKLVEIMLKEKLLTVDKTLGTEKIEGHRSREYEVSYHLDRLQIVYQQMAKYARSENLDATMWESAATQIGDPAFTEWVNTFYGQQKMRVWVDESEGFLRKIETTSIMIPPDSVEKMAGKQLSATMSMTLKNINQAVEIDTPAETMTLEEAGEAISGIFTETTSADQELFGQQATNVSGIWQALETYASIHGSYPDSLSELQTDMQKPCTDTSLYSCAGYSATPLELSDVYSGAAYPYTSTGTDYTLIYQMKYYDGILEMEKEAYADGTNTATSGSLSIEADEKLEEDGTNTNASSDDDLSDQDGDGLSKLQEEYYGSNPSLSDSDGDGYDDATEINNGYSPTGPGALQIPASN